MINRFTSMTALVAGGALMLATGGLARAADVADGGQAAVRAERQVIVPHDPSWPDYLKLESHPAVRRGRPVVEGRLLNDGVFSASNVQLLVEALDAQGSVVAHRIEWLWPRELTPGTSGYFAIPVPEAAARYRVSVYSFQASAGK
jgi:hypothetical protein